MLSIPELETNIEERIASFLDSITSECWSEFCVENQYSYSYYFEISSPIARGKKELLLLSVVLDRSDRAEIPREKVIQMIDWIKKEDKIFYAFHGKNSKYYAPQEHVNAIQKLEQKIGELLDHINFAIKEQKAGTIIIFGLDKAGKTTLINSFKERIFSPAVKPTLGFQILKMAIGNLDLKVIDAPGQKSLRERWWNFQTNINGITFVVDISDNSNRLIEAKEIFQELMNRFYSNENEIPLLIIANKIDVLESQIDKIQLLEKFKKEFELNSNVHIYHHELMSAKTGEGIQKGFRWLFGELIGC